MPPTAASLRFAHFELQPHERRLLVAGKPAALGARALDILIFLVERQGALVSKNELLDRVWPNLVVEENNLAVQISALRKVLGGDIIATIPGRGYRFTAQVEAPGDGSPSPTAAPARSAETPKLGVPENLTPLIGRENELAELGALIRDHRLITILGAGGIGKSSVARALLRAHRDRFTHGVCWVDLSPLPASGALPDALPAALAASLDVRLGGGDPLGALALAAAPLDVLIALDNAEHIHADVGRVAERLLPNAPRVRLMVTSQAPLKAAGERLYRLGPLSWPSAASGSSEAMTHSAVALFVERAQAVDRRFVLDDANFAEVVALCRALDGLPLAIELAAARLPLLGLAGLNAALDQRLRLLTGGTHGAPARQQTLRAALEWSHGQLGADERAVLRRLAVFVGSASLPMVRAVAADERLDEWAVLDALGGLVDRSLVAVDLADPADTPRYRLLDTPRAFALEQLAASGEMDVVRARHAAAVRDRFECAYEEGWSGRVGVEAWVESLQPDIDNAREAFAWACVHDAPCAVAIGSAVIGLLPASASRERYAMWETMEPLLTDDIAPPLRARALLEGAETCASLQWRLARTYAERATTMLRELGDRFMLYRALARLAQLAAPDDATAARAALAEMRELEVAAWPARRLLCGVTAEQACASWFHDPHRGLDHSYRLMRLESEAGSASLHGLLCVVDIELELRHAVEALKAGLDLVARLQGTRFVRGFNMARVNLVEAWLANDDPAQARAVAVAGWPDAMRFEQQATWGDSLALLAALEGRPRASALLRGFAEAMYARGRLPRQVAEGITVERAEGLARKALGDAEFAHLVAEGKAMREQDIAAIAFAERDLERR